MTENQDKNPQTNREITKTQLYSSLAIESLDTETRVVVNYIYQEEFKLDQFTELAEALNSESLILQYRGCIGLRKLLSIDCNQQIQKAIDLNCVPRFIQFLKRDLPVLQYEAAWCLANITAGTTHQTKFLVDKGVIPVLCKLLSSNYSDILDTVILAIGNILGVCFEYRDLILEQGALTPLVNILMNTRDKQIIEHGTWTMSGFFLGDPLPDYELVKNTTEPLCKVLMQEVDQENLLYSALAMIFLSAGGERIQRVINTGVVEKLLQHIGHSNDQIQIHCLRTLANICTGNCLQIDFVLSSGALPQIFKLINHSKKAVRIEACKVLSNIAAGTSQQTSQIIQMNGLVEELFKQVLGDSEDVSREAIYVLSNCTFTAHHMDILKLVEIGVIEVFASVLESTQDSKYLIFVLESIRQMLECGEKHFKLGEENPFTEQLQTQTFANALDQIETNPDDNVYKCAAAILDKYFEKKTEESYQNNIE